MANSCTLQKKNLGLGSCPAMPGYYKSMFWTPLNWFIPAATIAAGSAAVIAFIQSALTAGTIHKFPTFFSNEDQSSETVYQTTVLGKREVAPGFYEWLINFSDSLCSHKALRTFKTNTGRLAFLDTKGQLVGTDPGETGDFYGQTIQLLNPEKMKMNTGTEVSMSPVRVVLEDNLEMDQYGAILSVSGISSLVELTDAEIVIVEAADDELTVTVQVACDGTPINGLEEADFVNLDSDGIAASITDVVDNGNGSYTISGAFETGGTIKLAPAVDLSVEGYDGGTGTEITIAS